MSKKCNKISTGIILGLCIVLQPVLMPNEALAQNLNNGNYGRIVSIRPTHINDFGDYNDRYTKRYVKNQLKRQVGSTLGVVIGNMVTGMTNQNQYTAGLGGTLTGYNGIINNGFINRYNGLEITVRLDDGRIKEFIYPNMTNFRIGDRVVVDID